MKKLALTIAVFFCLLVAAFAQPLKSTGLWYFQGAPDVVPASIKGVEVAVSLDEQKVYVWDRTGSAWVDILDGVSFDTDQIEDIVGALMVRSPQDGVSVVYDDLTGTLSITADVTAQTLTDSLNAVRVKIPTSLSDLPNDAGFITDPDDADASPVNEIQALTISNDTIFLTGGGFVKIPSQPTPDAQDVQAGDAGAYYATDNVEDQLQEAGADRAQIQSSIPTSNAALTNDAGYTTAENKAQYRTPLEQPSEIQATPGVEYFYRDAQYTAEKRPVYTDEYYPFYSFIAQDPEGIGENLLHDSDNIEHSSFSVGWSLSGALRTPLVVDGGLFPDGQKTMEIVVVPNSSPGNTIRQTIKPAYRIEDGKSYNLSFFAGGLSDSSSLAITGSLSNFGLPSISNVDTARIFVGNYKKVRRFSMSLLVDADSVKTPLLVLRIENPQASDSFYLGGIMLEESTSLTPSPYIATGEDSDDFFTKTDSIYITKKIENGILKLTKFDLSFYEDGDDLLQAAANFCFDSGLCNSIDAPNLTIKDPVNWPETISLAKTNGEKRVFTIAPNDSTLVMFNLDDRGSPYVRDVRFQDTEFVVESPTYAIVQTNRHLDFYFDNCRISGEDQCDIGVILGGVDGGAIGSYFVNDYSILSCGIGVDCRNLGNIHHFEGGVVSRNGIGVQVDGGTLFTFDNGYDSESNDVAFNIIAGGSLRIEDAYFENGVIVVKDMRKFVFENSRISGGDFDIQNTLSTIIRGNDFFSSGDVSGDPGELDLSNNIYTSWQIFTKVLSTYFPVEGNTSCGNASTTGQVQKRCYNGLDFDYAPDTTYVNNIVFQGDSYISGIKQNLTAFSDSVMIADGSYPYYDVFNNIESSPRGTQGTADLIAWTLDWDGNGKQPTPGRDLVLDQPVGTELTVSQWVKAMPNANNSSGLMKLSYLLKAGAGGQVIVHWVPQDGLWHRVIIGSDSIVSVADILKIEFSSPLAGDSIYMDHLQLTLGREPGPEISTTTTGVNESGPANIDGTINFLGPVSFEQPITGVKEQYQEDFTATASQSTVVISAATTAIDIKDIEVFWGIDNVSLVKILSDPTTGYSWDAATKTVTFNGITISDGDKINVVWNE